MRRAASLAGAALALAGAAPASADNLYVAKSGSNANACSLPSAPCLTIAGAVAKAEDNDTINIGPGTYSEGITAAIPLTFVGAGAGNAQGYDDTKDTFVDASTLSVIGFDLNHGGALRNLRVRGGGSGGGADTAADSAITLHAFNASAPVTYTVDGVVAIGGSSGALGRAAITVNDSGGTGAAVTLGVTGATYLTTPVAGFLNGVVAIVAGANTAATFDGTSMAPPLNGTGLNVGTGAAATFKNGTILGFFKPLTGAAATSAGTELHIDHSTVQATSTPVAVFSGTALTIDDSLIVARRDAGSGTPEALRVSSTSNGVTTTGTVRNSTLFASGPGVLAAAAADAGSGGTATLSIANSALQATDTDGTPGDADLVANAPSGSTATITAESSSFSDRSQVGVGTATEPGTGSNVSGDPKFTAPADDNFVPAAGSPLIDHANPALVPAGALDLAGNPRGVDGDADCSTLPDIGAYEAPESTRPDCIPVPDTTAPKVTLGPPAQRLPKAGMLGFAVTCPATEPDPCAGTLTVATVARFGAGPLTLGSAGIGPLAPGGVQLVAIPLLPAVQKQLRAKRALRVLLSAALTDPAGNAGTSTKTVLVTTRPSLGISGRALKRDRHGRVALRVSCPAGEPGPCRGKLVLRSGRAVLATARLRPLAPGRSRTVRLRVAKQDRNVHVQALATLTDKFGNTGRSKRSLTLRTG